MAQFKEKNITTISEGSIVKIASFEEIKANVQDFIKTLPTNVFINDEDTKIMVKANRTICRKKIKQIDELRKRADEIILGTLKAQCKELTTMLSKADDKMKTQINDYDARVKSGEETTPGINYVLTINASNLVLLKQIIFTCDALGLKYDLKEIK